MIYSQTIILNLYLKLLIQKKYGILENKILINKENIIKYKNSLITKKESPKKLVSIGINNISKINKFSFPKLIKNLIIIPTLFLGGWRNLI